MIQQGDQLPEFEAENQEGEKVSSKEIDDAVIYFYPKADTPGCTKEACGFRDAISRFEDLGIQVLGVSTDSVEEQKAFHEEQGLNFDLLADERGDVSERFGVLDGDYAERTTFVVRDGVVEKVFRRVDPDGHVEQLIGYLRDK